MDSSGTLAQRANAPPPPPSFAHPHSSSAAAADAGGAAVGDGSQKKLVSLLAFHHCFSSSFTSFVPRPLCQCRNKNKNEVRENRAKISLIPWDNL